MSKSNLLRIIISLGFAISTFFFLVVLESDSEDEFIRNLARQADITPLEIRHREADPLFKLGQSLFYDPVLSGDRSTSCSTCHSLEKGLSDGRRNSNNLEFLSTVDKSSGELVRSYRLRNAPDLWNRDHNDTKFLFWDGRLEIVDGEAKIFSTPFGAAAGEGFENLLELQSTFPMITEKEMRGYPNESSSDDLPAPHASRKNTYLNVTGEIPHAIHAEVLSRLLGRGDLRDVWQLTYLSAFGEAFPDVDPNDLSIVHVGKAIGHFEELAFSSNESPWDRFMSGDSRALSEAAKRGAKIFLGEGLCSGCHSGPVFSDFRFHHVGLLSEPIEHAGQELDDLGRFAVTGDPADKFRFRTPPLRNVAQSSPYFHDGSSVTLSEAIKRHSLSGGLEGYFDQGRMRFRTVKMSGLSPLIKNAPKLNDEQVSDLVSFLSSITGQRADDNFIVPKSVISGLEFKR